MALDRLDDWQLAHRLVCPMGTEVVYIRPLLPESYWVEKERRRAETRTEFIRRGYTGDEVAEIARGEEFWVVARHKARERLTRSLPA